MTSPWTLPSIGSPAYFFNAGLGSNGIALAFGWESWVAFVPGLTRKLTAMHYIQSLSPHASGRNAAVALLQQGAGRFESVVALIVILAGFALLAGWTFSRREYEFDLSKR